MWAVADGQSCPTVRFSTLDIVLLVSRTDFAESAKAKAERHGIRLYTLDTAAPEDWPASVKKVLIVPYTERAQFMVNFVLQPVDGSPARVRFGHESPEV